MQLYITAEGTYPRSLELPVREIEADRCEILGRLRNTKLSGSDWFAAGVGGGCVLRWGEGIAVLDMREARIAGEPDPFVPGVLFLAMLASAF